MPLVQEGRQGRKGALKFIPASDGCTRDGKEWVGDGESAALLWQCREGKPHEGPR